MHGWVGSQTMGGAVRWACDSVMRTVCKRPVHATSRERRRPPARWTDPASRPAAFWTNRTPATTSCGIPTHQNTPVRGERKDPSFFREIGVCWCVGVLEAQISTPLRAGRADASPLNCGPPGAHQTLDRGQSMDQLTPQQASRWVACASRSWRFSIEMRLR